MSETTTETEVEQPKPQCKPHFEWVKFRRSHNSIAMYSPAITSAFQSYIFYLYTQQNKKTA